MKKQTIEVQDESSSTKDRPRLSSDDPALIVLNKMAEQLEPFDRLTQLKILASVCVTMGMYDYAQQFIDAAKRESSRG